MKARVPIAGTIGKSISFDPRAGERAEAAVAALAAQISAGLGGNILHRNLLQLQVGDDHPQYAGNAFPETITGQWNFQTIPQIQGSTLAEYIEDVVGGSFFDFLQDTSSVVWTFHDTANELEANVPPEFVQDTIGAILTDTASIDLVYNDGANTISANVIDEYVEDLVGAMLQDTASINLVYGDTAGSISANVVDEYVEDLVGGMLSDTASINLLYGDTAGQISANLVGSIVVAPAVVDGTQYLELNVNGATVKLAIIV